MLRHRTHLPGSRPGTPGTPSPFFFTHTTSQTLSSPAARIFLSLPVLFPILAARIDHASHHSRLSTTTTIPSSLFPCCSCFFLSHLFLASSGQPLFVIIHDPSPSLFSSLMGKFSTASRLLTLNFFFRVTSLSGVFGALFRNHFISLLGVPDMCRTKAMPFLPLERFQSWRGGNVPSGPATYTYPQIRRSTVPTRPV